MEMDNLFRFFAHYGLHLHTYDIQKRELKKGNGTRLSGGAVDDPAALKPNPGVRFNDGNNSRWYSVFARRPVPHPLLLLSFMAVMITGKRIS